MPNFVHHKPLIHKYELFTLNSFRNGNETFTAPTGTYNTAYSAKFQNGVHNYSIAIHGLQYHSNAFEDSPGTVEINRDAFMLERIFCEVTDKNIIAMKLVVGIESGPNISYCNQIVCPVRILKNGRRGIDEEWIGNPIPNYNSPTEFFPFSWDIDRIVFRWGWLVRSTDSFTSYGAFVTDYIANQPFLRMQYPNEVVDDNGLVFIQGYWRLQTAFVYLNHSAFPTANQKF